MMLSSIPVDVIMQYARIDSSNPEDRALLRDVILPAAQAHVLEYTGLTADAADEKPQLCIACLALCAFMFDHRDMVVEKPQINQVVDSILGSNAVNLML